MAMIGVASCWFNTLAGAGTGTSRYTVSSQRLFSSSSAATRLVIPKAASQNESQRPKKKRLPKNSSPEKEANIQKLSRRSRDENQYSNADDQNGIKNAEQPQSTAFKSFGTQRKNAKGFMGTLKDQQAESTQIQDASFLNAVVKVYCTHTAPDYSLPWQKQRQYTSTGSAFMIGDGKLLTNAHCVEHNTQVKVKKRGDDTKYVAKVLAKGMECDIALLSVENEKFWKGAEPLQFGHLPRLQDPVTVVGYPLGGDTISVTKGVVSRIEVTSYAHGSAELLGIQIDAAINPGNSGGPAFNDQGECIGVAFQVYRSDDTENIGYVIPTTVVSHFLDDYERNGKYTGFPSLGILLQKLENPALRACLKVPSNEGVLVRRVEPTSGASNVLKEGDVIVSFDGVDVGSEGTVPFRSTERIAFRYLISQKFTGDIAELGIIRAGASMKVQTAMNPRVHLVPYHIEGGQPSYLIVAGLVFTPLSEPLIDEECEDSIGLKLLTKARYSMARFKGEQIVILSQFFTVISRVATILKTRYTSPGFWSAGLGLFLEAEQLVSESSEKQHLHTCIARAREQLSEIENQPEESAQNRRNQGYLFEGHLTVDQEPPRPQWLVQSNLMTALAASMSQAQTSTDGATDGFNSLPQELMDRIHELVPNISDESNNLPQEMIDRLVAMFPEGDSVAKAPPASKEVVAKLPVITITDEILAKLGPDAECAICKENLLVNDKMQEMPCKHTFHPPCLKPWLDEHNSCLICRHELRTNDHEYESRKEREKEAEEERKGAANSVREGEYMYV